MFNQIPCGFGGRVTRSYVGGASLGPINSSLSVSASVNLGTETADRRVIILCAGQSSTGTATALNFSSFSMTGSPTFTTVYSVGGVFSGIGRASAIGLAHVPTGTSVTVTANFSQSGTVTAASLGLLVYSVYGLSSNTPYADGAYGSYHLPTGSVAIALAHKVSAPTWTGATQDAFQVICSGASYATDVEETGRTISASGTNQERVTIWAPG
jgi:hypothetical protein